jgi:hypothetical protein
MLLFTTFYGNANTFKLMPLSHECTFEMLPKLDDNGDIMKTKQPRNNGKPFREERRNIRLPQEYYFADRKEQEDFIKAWAINADTFDYAKYLDEKESEVISKIETPELVDAKGGVLKAEK